MSGRFPQYRGFDYCLNPIHVIQDGKDVVVPCGKCDGCLLHKANEWSMRITEEIEQTPFSLFFTLTYSNEFLPTLVQDYTRTRLGEEIYYCSDHVDNWRMTLDKDFKPVKVHRNDGIIISSYGYDPLPIQKDCRTDCIPYASKRDIQLWLKLLRAYLYSPLFPYNFPNEKRRFRYYIISEFGPTTLRPHFHGIIFPSCGEVAEFLLNEAMFKSWQMCDYARFRGYAKYCDSGASGYVSQYLTCNSSLPRVYKENKEIRPFRLASKGSAIGFNSFSSEEISQKISGRINSYCKPIQRLGHEIVLQFPKNYTCQQFPKCYRYKFLSDFGLYCVYANSICNRGNIGQFIDGIKRHGCWQRPFLWFSNDEKRVNEVCYYRGFQFFEVDETKAQNQLVARRVKRFTNGNLLLLDFYMYCIDMLDYLTAMECLRAFYLYQDTLLKDGDKKAVCRLYSNFSKLCHASDSYSKSLLMSFCSSIGINSLVNFNFNEKDGSYLSYELELKDILSNMIKSSKYNELVGVAPTVV